MKQYCRYHECSSRYSGCARETNVVVGDVELISLLTQYISYYSFSKLPFNVMDGF